ncbi:acetylglutamate kinase [Paludicola sp. MB14-C6]|uniref:acetylglutamate kinase n=1 Tax=Paludihabitans sp. MB14-C6 TaxID=3070656 RepID=UPI0027DC195A|nr:acetylglutamate kinase [Paludicola sp. MB14-C6]WMJ22183.1 acetylglutamate kinase [Paludicola sp. MB14-C6]
MPDKISDSLRAQILVDALPYIQKYNDKIVVVKYGGNAMTCDELKTAVMSDVVLLSLVGIKVVLVHGGGPEINEMLEKIGKESKFINGLRYTDAETMDVVQMVLCGKVNKNLVSLLQQSGGKAIGLCGMDGNLIQAEKKQSAVDLGFVGNITDVDVTLIMDALNNGYIPVISTVGVGNDGQAYNINADTAAAKIAAKLGAENLILMTDIKGLLEDKDDESTLIPVVQINEVENLMKKNIISGGMIPKIECCVDAIRGGVNRSFIIDGRIPHSILIEMFTSEGVGTMFR